MTLPRRNVSCLGIIAALLDLFILHYGNCFFLFFFEPGEDSELRDRQSLTCQVRIAGDWPDLVHYNLAPKSQP